MTDPTDSRIGGHSAHVGPEQDRLVILTNIPTPYRTSFFDTLAQRLEQNQIALHVLYCAAREPNRHWIFDPSVPRHAFTIMKGLHLGVGGGYLHLNPSIRRRLTSLAPRWFISGGAWHLPTGLLAGLRTLPSRPYRILWTEGHADAVLHEGGPISALRKRVFAGYDAFAVPNRRSGEFALAQAGNARPVLPLANTVDENLYERPSNLDKVALRTRLGIDPDVRVLVSVSQLEDRKSVVELANAYASLDERSRNRTLLAFLGDGDRRTALETIARSNHSGEIRLLGHVAQETVRDWLWAADGFVLATRNDPNPLSPIEASFAGLPLLLSSRAGNVDELVIDGETGWRLASVDEPGIRSGLSTILGCDRSVLERMGDAAHRNANTSFRRSSVADRFIEALIATRAD